MPEQKTMTPEEMAANNLILTFVAVGALALGALIGWYFTSRSLNKTAVLNTEKINKLKHEKKTAETLVNTQKETLRKERAISEQKAKEIELKKVELQNAKNALVKMKSESESSHSEEIDRVVAALEAAQLKIERMEDLYLATKIIDLKGVGAAVEKTFAEKGITMRLINSLSNNELDEVLDEAMVPMAARKHNLKSQAKKTIDAMNKAIGG